MSALETLNGLLPSAALSEPESAGAQAPAAWAGRAPASVVRPGSVEEVVSVMRWADAEGIGVLPCGTGAWSRPVPGERPYVALSTSRLAGIRVYEPADLTLTAGAGTVFADVDAALRENRQWAPFDPPCADRRTLGGLVADGETGPLWTGYGELRNHVLGMTVVTGDGRTLRLGGGVVKNVAGYDLLKAMVGSRGRLAVVTSVCVRAFPEPAVDQVLAATAPSIGELVPLALALGRAPVLPASIVLADRVSELGGNATLVLRVHGAPATVAADRRTLEASVAASFEEVGDAHRGPLLRSLRDRGADAPVRLTASTLPSRLLELLEAVQRLEPESVTVDGYRGLVRLGCGGVEAEAFEAFRSRVVELGGALRLEAWPTEASEALPWSEPAARARDAGEPDGSARVLRMLTRRLEDAFDPGGVLWPCRR